MRIQDPYQPILTNKMESNKVFIISLAPRSRFIYVAPAWKRLLMGPQPKGSLVKATEN